MIYVHLSAPLMPFIQEMNCQQGQEQFLALNAQLSEVWPIITEVITPQADADQFNGVPDKLEHLIFE